MKNYKIFAINPGSISTKIALYNNEQIEFVENIKHPIQETKIFKHIYEQCEYRFTKIINKLNINNINLQEIDAVVGRGGLVKPLSSGTYIINESLCNDLNLGIQGEHVSNLGGLLAKLLADKIEKPAFIVDPICVDEMQEIAKFTGLPKVKRRSLFHALNLRAIGFKIAIELNKSLFELNLVMAHLGNSISIAACKKGRMIDICNPNDEGGFSPDRVGGLPNSELIKICYSFKYSFNELKSKLVGNSGLLAYFGTNSAKEIIHRINNGDKKAETVLKAMAYNTAKQIGALACVLDGDVNAIVLTGELAYEIYFTSLISEKVKWIAPVKIIPGEDEMQALNEGVLRVLRGKEKAKYYF